MVLSGRVTQYCVVRTCNTVLCGRKFVFAKKKSICVTLRAVSREGTFFSNFSRNLESDASEFLKIS